MSFDPSLFQIEHVLFFFLGKLEKHSCTQTNQNTANQDNQKLPKNLQDIESIPNPQRNIPIPTTKTLFARYEPMLILVKSRFLSNQIRLKDSSTFDSNFVDLYCRLRWLSIPNWWGAVCYGKWTKKAWSMFVIVNNFRWSS